MPLVHTGQGYKYPTDTTLEQGRAHGFPSSHGGSGGYNQPYAPGEATGPSHQQGSSGSSAHVDQQVHARDSAGGPSREQGAAGGSAYMDQQVYARDSARASSGPSGICMTTPDGVSTHFAGIYAREQAMAEAGARAAMIDSAVNSMFAANRARDQVNGARKNVAAVSVGAWLKANPGFEPSMQLHLAHWYTLQQDHDPSMAGPKVPEYGVPVKSSALQSGSGVVFPHKQVGVSKFYTSVLVEQPFVDAHRQKVVHDMTSGGRPMSADSWFGAPLGNAVKLTDGRMAQPFQGLTEAGYFVLTEGRVERYPQGMLVKAGLLPADGNAPPFHNLTTVTSLADQANVPEPAKGAQAALLFSEPRPPSAQERQVAVNMVRFAQKQYGSFTLSEAFDMGGSNRLYMERFSVTFKAMVADGTFVRQADGRFKLA
jgi:hypothetical protein